MLNFSVVIEEDDPQLSAKVTKITLPFLTARLCKARFFPCRAQRKLHVTTERMQKQNENLVIFYLNQTFKKRVLQKCKTPPFISLKKIFFEKWLSFL